eukprot:CAMPEP_0179069636 /NCGR_PEP_ID=MMETSP0796-20121207/30609_1 /TAXON_ID=73915 /ORGANISM="Pyrodinium bahamense, Strain pbaha01" /LENGTH=265 /DNA_ID=CAMNT_0020766707 /DNA_START=87 /DNA_END=880 /DNA_ORIENTATION=-
MTASIRHGSYVPLPGGDDDDPPAPVVVGVPLDRSGPVLLGRPTGPFGIARGPGAHTAAQKPPASPLAAPATAPSLLPVMLPAYAVARPAAAAAAEPGPEWILAPGPDSRPITVSGRGAVCAGVHHAPHGRAGAAVGTVAGALLGWVPLVVLPGAGYFAAKKIARMRHTIGMLDEAGQIVNVKLWKAGKHAPLTEEGYWLVASDSRDSEMELFIRRVIARMGGWVADTQALHAFALRHSGRHGISSLAWMEAELRSAYWVEHSGMP